ncbi:aldolase [Sphingobium sp. SCG-1]|uniref:class II aldolase/adducin family protein n=1 Tax=Sphingobium sp. SCG-1 TaxID=2072936 RepID=UPI000CD6B2FD|nr:class II aldolase/adducin family protein [Sphingobium sp. SCG-1]AUW57099.1 aldolase [Sphingobium sp. SCG-1]
MNEPAELNSADEAGGHLAGLKAELVKANKILVRYGIVDAFGHISVRHPSKPGIFLMARSVPPGVVQTDDIKEHRLDGELVNDDGSKLFLERFIHGEIFAARPEVQSVVHSHSPTIVAFGVVESLPLQAICHTCGFLKGPTPNFEMRDFAGDDTNLLIDSREKAHSLVGILADKNVVLMRGHGSTVVGSSIGQAVYRAVYTETNARIQATATTLGTIKYLSDAEADACEALNEKQVERTWQLWKHET